MKANNRIYGEKLNAQFTTITVEILSSDNPKSVET